MIKSFWVMKRRNGLTRDQFLRHWKEIHGPMFLSKKDLPQLRKYIQNHPAKVTRPEFDTDIDGIAELWFDDIESAQAFLQWHRFSDEAKELREDDKLLANVKEGFNLFAEEHAVKS